MKRLFLFFLIIPFASVTGFVNRHETTTSLAEVRSGEWPITLERTIERSDTSYSLQFRDEQVMNSIVMDTLTFQDLGQLKYFGRALTVLKTGNNGDIAKFKDYSIKRAEKKYEGVWYILRMQWSLTNFRQPEADIMISTIRGL